jgi:ADP-heptose:LPS heptosyltransferase
MNKTLLIDGGMGRVVCAIPALERFVQKHPETTIVTYGWTQLLWGNKLLTDKVFDNTTKGLFQRIRNTQIIKPEPYYNIDYINERAHLIAAFNQEINLDKEPVGVPKLYLSSTELANAAQLRKYANGRKVIAFQPLGSTAKIEGEIVVDTSVRSLNTETIKYLVSRLKRDYALFLVTDQQIGFLSQDDFIPVAPSDVRALAAILANCDYLLGIDSSAQHIARCFNKPGSVIFGGTNVINASYPDHYNIINDIKDKKYMPFRFAEFEWHLAELENGNLLNFTKQQLDEITTNITKHIKSTT